MIYPSIDKLLNTIGSKFLLVNLVSKRVKELEEKRNYQFPEHDYVSKKNIGRALEEVSKDLIVVDKLVNASIIDGLNLSEAQVITFKHLDYENLQDILRQHRE